MSSLTLLTAAVVVLGLSCWVPTGAFYPRMKDCNRTTMPVVADLSLADWADRDSQCSSETALAVEVNNDCLDLGRWYQTHATTNWWTSFQYDGVAADAQMTIPLATDRRGQVDQDFLVGEDIFTDPTTGNCSYSGWLVEVIDGKLSGAYQTWYSDLNAGYYIYLYDSYVLATDYTSTAVMLTEKILNGYTDIIFAQIKVFVRDPAVSPDADVVNAALSGFCKGAALDLSSNFYQQIPNDSDLPCFAPPAK